MKDTLPLQRNLSLHSSSGPTHTPVKITHEMSQITTCIHAKLISHVRLFVTPWTVAHQAPLSMGFSRQGYWSGLPFPPPGNLPHAGIKPASLESPALAGRFFTTAPYGNHWSLPTQDAKGNCFHPSHSPSQPGAPGTYAQTWTRAPRA